MKPSAALLLLCAAVAHAQETPRTEATGLPCPNGPGVAVVAIDAGGNEEFAGCWGSEPYWRDEPRRHEERHRRDDHDRRDHKQ